MIVVSMTCRILIDAEPAPGAWNMAVDELLLESAVHAGVCSVRTYRWREPTVSLGHFQNEAAVREDPRLAGLPVVRRLSGGGAILHHHEVTYSCAVPAGHPAVRNPTALYETVHAALVGVLAEAGVTVRLRGETGAGDATAFLCYSRGDPRDIVREGHKIVGSAQRRRRGTVLQHGSILLKASEFAPRYPGLAELAGWERPAPELAVLIAHALADAIGESRRVAELTPEERDRVREFERTAQQEFPAR